MPWEFIFPNLIAGDAPLAADLLADLHAETLMDSDAFAAFYQRSARPLWAYLVRVSSDPALADDLMQESFVRFLCSGRPELSLAEGEVAARKYLFRIATNLLRDHWRRPSAASIDEIPDEFFAASDLTGQADSQAILGPALALLRPRERQLLWLAHAEGYSHREIAQITGLASASIRLLLFRARRRIARILLNQSGGTRGILKDVENGGQSQQAASLRSQL